MAKSTPPAPRGRPPSITPARITAAGAALTLPRLSFVGVATALGVSHIALYKHVANLAALKELVADGIFAQWQAPALQPGAHSQEEDLMRFHRSLRALVLHNPGLAPYLVRQGSKTAGMLRRIQAHHQAFAQTHGLTGSRAAWLLNTVAFHCVALADTVYAADPAQQDEPAHHQAEANFDRGMRALVRGLIASVDDAAQDP